MKVIFMYLESDIKKNRGLLFSCKGSDGCFQYENEQ